MASGHELSPRAGDAVAAIHVPISASFYEAAIEGVTRVDEEMLRSAHFPRLYESGVQYRKEDKDTWRHADDVLCSGWGDCDDLSPWRAAELRVSGEDPKAYVYVYRSGPRRFHAVVARGDGRIEDPSYKLGMPVSEARARQLPKFVGDTEMQDSQARPFATCSRVAEVGSACDGCPHMSGAAPKKKAAKKSTKQHNPTGRRVLAFDQGHGEGASGFEPAHALGGDPTMEAIGTGSLLTDPFHVRERLASIAHRVPSKYRPIGEAAKRIAPLAAMLGGDGGGGGHGGGVGQDEDYPDDGSDQPDDGSDQPDDGGEEAAPGGPSAATRALNATGRGIKGAATAIYQPFKYAGMPLYYGGKLGYGVLKAGGEGARALSKVASVPMNALHKLTSLFGVDENNPLGGAPRITPAMLGIVDDPYYFPGDEDRSRKSKAPRT